MHSDPEKRLDGHADASLSSGETLRYENKGLAVWTACSGHGRSGNRAWFDHRRGQIIVKNPDEEILEKVYLIAKVLHARVQGDDGEIIRGRAE